MIKCYCSSINLYEKETKNADECDAKNFCQLLFEQRACDNDEMRLTKWERGNDDVWNVNLIFDAPPVPNFFSSRTVFSVHCSVKWVGWQATISFAMSTFHQYHRKYVASIDNTLSFYWNDYYTIMLAVGEHSRDLMNRYTATLAVSRLSCCHTAICTFISSSGDAQPNTMN